MKNRRRQPTAQGAALDKNSYNNEDLTANSDNPS